MEETIQQLQIEAAQRAAKLFADTTPDFVADEPTLLYLANFVCANNLNQFSSASYRQAFDDLKSMKAERREFAMSAADYKAQILDPDLKQRQPVKPTRATFRPAREYTAAEIDGMSSAEYKAAVLGIVDSTPEASRILATPQRSGQRKHSTSFRALKRAGIERD